MNNQDSIITSGSHSASEEELLVPQAYSEERRSSSQRKKAFIGAICGQIFEWYDYAIYGFLAVYIGANFFASGDPAVNVISAFAVFALAFFIRPIGGIIFGPMADKIGRKKTLLIVLTLMSGSTVVMGLLPVSAAVGLLAPALLILLRLIQGVSAGGELGTINTFIAENASKGNKGSATSVIAAASIVGLLLGAFVANGMSWALGAGAMTAWGWRIPFLLAAPLGLLAIYIRTKLEETPDFKALKEENGISKSPLRETLRHPKQLFLVFSAVTFMGSSIYMVMTYSTTYLTAVVGFEWGPTFGYVVLAGVIAIVLAPISGKIGDKFARRKNYLVLTSVLVALAMVWFFFTAPAATPSTLLAPWIALSIAFGLLLGNPMAMMSELLPVRLRSTGSAIGYNVAIAVFGGSAPFIASSLIAWTKDPSSPVWYFLLTALVSVGGLLLIRDKDLLGKDH
ncbi:MFS transporter [Arthrobacter sp. StoSoilA2]|uniref:MFS transporter n=1 Tax=Arthrobacter sp. StoSoilA2 TaxID=2830990 RepID=UPI001CC3D548|nr:MFS transporter [Arthrobacter sp. StoSoilA2]BCW35927.1 MFS transporter [Arthrobacter sp. StoSoilA2]